MSNDSYHTAPQSENWKPLAKHHHPPTPNPKEEAAPCHHPIQSRERSKLHLLRQTLRLTIGFDQHLLLAHVLHVDGAVDDVLRRGAVVVLHLLTLVALDLKGISCRTAKRLKSPFVLYTQDTIINRTCK